MIFLLFLKIKYLIKVIIICVENLENIDNYNLKNKIIFKFYNLDILIIIYFMNLYVYIYMCVFGVILFI